MAFCLRLAKASFVGKSQANLLKTSFLGITSNRRGYAYWNYEWKPGPFPKTPEERERAAKKYGLRPEDYKPYADDGTGHGDYPELPMISTNSRDVYEDYDQPMHKRNYGEPMTLYADLMREDCWDPSARRPLNLSYLQMFGFLCVFIGSYVVLSILLDPYPHMQPMLKKQFPRDLKEGEKHYTFEPAE